MRDRFSCITFLLAASCVSLPVRADIYRWDNAQPAGCICDFADAIWDDAQSSRPPKTHDPASDSPLTACD
jgi:hypothetical protein